MVGYLFRALEIAGFVLGGVLVPLALRSKPYCDPCRVYKRTSNVAVLVGTPHASAMPDDGPYADPVLVGLRKIFDAAAAGDRDALHAAIRTHGPLANQRAARRGDRYTTVALERCPRCAQSELRANGVEQEGRQIRTVALGAASLPGERIKALFDA